jgi:hypothetical protein
LVKSLSVVHTNNGADHLWNDDHITKMSLDDGRLLLTSLLLGLAKLLDEGEWAALQSALEASASTSME